jgi:uncharacterized repeat protein (TIGR02543 family)
MVTDASDHGESELARASISPGIFTIQDTPFLVHYYIVRQYTETSSLGAILNICACRLSPPGDAPSGSFAYSLASDRPAASVGDRASVTASLTSGSGDFTFYAGEYRIELPEGLAASNITMKNGWEYGVSQSGGRTMLTFARLVDDVRGKASPAYTAIATFDVTFGGSLRTGESVSINCLSAVLTDEVAFARTRVNGNGLTLAMTAVPGADAGDLQTGADAEDHQTGADAEDSQTGANNGDRGDSGAVADDPGARTTGDVQQTPGGGQPAVSGGDPAPGVEEAVEEAEASDKTIALNTAGGTKVKAKVGVTLGRVKKPERKGYAFKGWYAKAKGGAKLKDSYVIQENAKIYAQWEPKKFKILYNANKGKLTGKKYKTVTYDEKYGKLQTPTRKGYKFAGWYTKAKGGKKIAANSKVAITRNSNLYARWKKV